jgi:hypothetical protein
MKRLAAIALLSILAVGLFQVSAEAQCSMCRTALENSPEGKGMASSFAKGILFLLAIPYALMGTIGLVLYRAHRKKKKADGSASRPANPYLPRE